jgi:hypothetical protein
MSDHPRDPPDKKPTPQEWLDELRERMADWLGTLLNPPLPVPVPVRRR